MEYVIPYLRIDELRELSQTCKEYNQMIDYYFGTKKKHTIQGVIWRNDFLWLMRKMKSLQHLTLDCLALWGGIEFDHLPISLDTLIIKENAHILWNSHMRRIQWNLPCLLYSLLQWNPRGDKKVFPHLKHIEVQRPSQVSICCLYDPVVDGYDEYGPKYDYTDDYIETDKFVDCIPFHTIYKSEYKRIYDLPKDTHSFPALERFILPQDNKDVEPITQSELESLPWPSYNQAVPESDPIISM